MAHRYAFYFYSSVNTQPGMNHWGLTDALWSRISVVLLTTVLRIFFPGNHHRSHGNPLSWSQYQEDIQIVWSLACFQQWYNVLHKIGLVCVTRKWHNNIILERRVELTRSVYITSHHPHTYYLTIHNLSHSCVRTYQLSKTVIHRQNWNALHLAC